VTFNVTEIFPSPVWTVKNTFTQSEHEELIKFSYEVCEKYPNLDITSKRGGGGSSNALTIQHPVLMKYLEQSLGQIIKDFEPVTALRMQNYWVNINPPGAYMLPHVHPRAVLGCTMYIQTPPNSGRITFINPNLAARQAFYSVKDAGYNYKSYSFQPVPGLFIAFPAWIEHGVEENLSNSDRISISFNIIADDI
jgi:uncharacterized protein (TIGR02466 family)